MKGSIRLPSHHPARAPEALPPDYSNEERFIGRPCYVFNPQLRASLNDTRCSHCRFYLTSLCPHIDEFLDDVDELSPE